MIKGMNHITLAVRDIEKSFIFYRDVLELKPLVLWDSGAYFLVADATTNFTDSEFWFCLNVDKNRIINPCYTHYAFTVPEVKFIHMAEKIMAAGAYVFKNNTSPGESLYFLDPDGHKLEIHTGNWKIRIAVKKENSGKWKNVKWFI